MLVVSMDFGTTYSVQGEALTEFLVPQMLLCCQTNTSNQHGKV